MNDKKNAIKSLQTVLRNVRYPDGHLNLKELSDGSAKEHLKVYHYIFLSYSAPLASEILIKYNQELSHKSDKLFIDGVYKLTRDMLCYVPKLTKDQFFQTNFAQQKCQMTLDIVKLVQQKCKSFPTPPHTHPTQITSETKPVTSSSSNSSISSSYQEESSSSSSQQQQKQQKPPTVQIKNHMMAAPLVHTANSNITSSWLASNLRSTKSFTSKSLTRPSSTVVVSKQQPQAAADAQTQQQQQHLEETINTLANTVQHLATVIGSFETRFEAIENSIASITSAQANIMPHTTAALVATDNNGTASTEKSIIKKIDNLAAKVTIIETDLILIKQQQQQQQQQQQHVHSYNQSGNADDTASYETPFVSFSHPNTEGQAGANCMSPTNFMTATTTNRIVNLEQFVMDNCKRNLDLNNESMLSNDSTPKFLGSKFSSIFDKDYASTNASQANCDSGDLARAKNLVMMAEKLITEVKI
jgi:Cu/Ag efflux protein CusF